MYSSVLVLHSWLRWVVLIAAVLALARAFAGRTQVRPWTKADESAMRWFTLSLDVQVLLGLLLYVALSPVTRAAFESPGQIMRTAPLRYWAVEHLVGMLAAVVLAHIGRARMRRVADPRQKHKRALVFTALALVAIFASIPWPGMPNGRPLFRLSPEVAGGVSHPAGDENRRGTGATSSPAAPRPVYATAAVAYCFESSPTAACAGRGWENR